MKRKMNACYILGFIFLMVCVGLLAAAWAVGYMLNQNFICTLLSLGGVLLAFAGIILVLCSKPKKPKPKKAKAPKNADSDL